MIDKTILMLNASFIPIKIISAKKAIILFYKGIADAVDEEYRTYDFISWMKQDPGEEYISLTNDRKMKFPHVIRLLNYNKLPSRIISFSRPNIFKRDKYRCQYCGKILERKDLTLDHIIPKSRGGSNTWENIVSACFKCNTKKSNRTPEEANMELLSEPLFPKYLFNVHNTLIEDNNEHWSRFLIVK